MHPSRVAYPAPALFALVLTLTAASLGGCVTGDAWAQSPPPLPSCTEIMNRLIAATRASAHATCTTDTQCSLRWDPGSPGAQMVVHRRLAGAVAYWGALLTRRHCPVLPVYGPAPPRYEAACVEQHCTRRVATTPPPPPPPPPSRPTMAQFDALQERMAAAVRACYRGFEGNVSVSLVFASSGVPRSVRVYTRRPRQDAARCAARAMRAGARVPRFEAASEPVTLTFPIRAAPGER